MRTLVRTAVILTASLQAVQTNQLVRTELPVADKSSPAAPLQPSGKATVSSAITSEGIESTSEMSATLKNISSKPILAFEAVSNLAAPYRDGMRQVTHIDNLFLVHYLIPAQW